MGGLGGPGITPGARSCDPVMGSLRSGTEPVGRIGAGDLQYGKWNSRRAGCRGDPSFVITQIRLPQNVGIRVLKDDLVGRRPESQEC